MSKSTTVLAIETSCDETGIAVLQREADKVTVLASALASQVDIHAATGGVVPEVAAREHTQVFRPLLQKILREANIVTPYSPPPAGGIGGKTLDAIAVTVGPGLMPALSVGVNAARTLAFAWNKPVVPVHHIEGHIYSALLYKAGMTNDQFPIPNDKEVFPALALIVSGGHTMLIEMQNHLQYNVLGETRDDAAGEAFDKVARLLDLPYPGGPHLSKLAESGDPTAFAFPRPMQSSPDLDFSFSGLKTAVLYKTKELGVFLPASPSDLSAKASAEVEARGRSGDKGGTGGSVYADLAASFQAAVVDSLIGKTQQALRAKKYQTLLLAGGVAANQPLRQALMKLAAAENIPLSIAPLNLCGDNAVMIGMVGLLALESGRTISWRELDASARIPIESFSISSDSNH